MITGIHAVIYSRDATADRAFFRDVLGFPSVDAGDGWLIFAAPPSEVACHPGETNSKHKLYLMCDDVQAEIARLDDKGIKCTSVTDEGWGLLTMIRLPGGGELGRTGGVSSDLRSANRSFIFGIGESRIDLPIEFIDDL
jgi:catechol 2,3-dioxygenase-like lactoylglutathione lyase family enzyme